MPAEPHRIQGATFSMDRNGVATFKVPYAIYVEDALATFDPGNAPLGLAIVERSASEDGGDWILWLVYEGIKEGTESIDLFELDDSTAEQPIDTYPDFGYPRWEKYKWDPDKKEFPKDIMIDGKKGLNPLYGTTSYLDINPVWRKTSVASDLPKGLLENVGCIDSPTGKKEPPALPGKRNWLKKSLKATWRGNCWVISEEWLASGRYKWNDDIYRTADAPGK